jgi:hypothetical protein
MTTTVKIPQVPLSESHGSMGDHVETPRTRGRSDGSFGAHVEPAPIPMSSTVNGTTFVLPVAKSEPK